MLGGEGGEVPGAVAEVAGVGGGGGACVGGAGWGGRGGGHLGWLVVVVGPVVGMNNQSRRGGMGIGMY